MIHACRGAWHELWEVDSWSLVALAQSTVRSSLSWWGAGSLLMTSCSHHPVLVLGKGLPVSVLGAALLAAWK